MAADPAPLDEEELMIIKMEEDEAATSYPQLPVLPPGLSKDPQQCCRSLQ